jgi:hypothetical protein
MATRQHPAVGTRRQPAAPPLEALAPDWPAAPEEPRWLWESLRHQFWHPTDPARAIGRAGPFPDEQREAIAYWWSLLAAVEGMGPPAYAAAFVGATERRDSDQVRWSLLAMLRDELQHEQFCRLALERFAPGWPRRYAPRTPLGRRANRHLDRVHREAECCWRHYQRGLTRHGLPVATGALLLSELAAGALCDRWADGCAIPALATALRHTASDARRHQAVLRALAARDWPSLAAPARAEAAVQVQATTGLLSVVMLDTAAGADLPVDLAASRRACQAAACQAGLGVPTAEQRQELLRAALLEVKDLQHRYDIPFPAMPGLAILGTEESAVDA